MDLNKIRQYMRGIALNAFRMIKFLYDFISSDRDTIQLDVYEVKETNTNPKDIEVGDLTILNVPTLRGLSNRVTNLLGYLNKISFIDLDQWKSETRVEMWGKFNYDGINNYTLFPVASYLVSSTFTVANTTFSSIAIHKENFSLNDKRDITRKALYAFKTSFYPYSNQVIYTPSFAFKIGGYKISGFYRRWNQFLDFLQSIKDINNLYIEGKTELKSNNLKTPCLELPINLNYFYPNSIVLIDKDFDKDNMFRHITFDIRSFLDNSPVSSNKFGNVININNKKAGFLNYGPSSQKMEPNLHLGNNYYIDNVSNIVFDNSDENYYFGGKTLNNFLKNNSFFILIDNDTKKIVFNNLANIQDDICFCEDNSSDVDYGFSVIYFSTPFILLPNYYIWDSYNLGDDNEPHISIFRKVKFINYPYIYPLDIIPTFYYQSPSRISVYVPQLTNSPTTIPPLFSPFTADMTETLQTKGFFSNTGDYIGYNNFNAFNLSFQHAFNGEIYNNLVVPLLVNDNNDNNFVFSLIKINKNIFLTKIEVKFVKEWIDRSDSYKIYSRIKEYPYLLAPKQIDQWVSKLTAYEKESSEIYGNLFLKLTKAFQSFYIPYSFGKIITHNDISNMIKSIRKMKMADFADSYSYDNNYDFYEKVIFDSTSSPPSYFTNYYNYPRKGYYWKNILYKQLTLNDDFYSTDNQDGTFTFDYSLPGDYSKTVNVYPVIVYFINHIPIIFNRRITNTSKTYNNVIKFKYKNGQPDIEGTIEQYKQTLLNIQNDLDNDNNAKANYVVPIFYDGFSADDTIQSVVFGQKYPFLSMNTGIGIMFLKEVTINGKIYLLPLAKQNGFYNLSGDSLVKISNKENPEKQYFLIHLSSKVSKVYENDNYASNTDNAYDYFYIDPVLNFITNTASNDDAPPIYSYHWISNIAIPNPIYPIVFLEENDDLKWYGVLKREVSRLINNNVAERVYLYTYKYRNNNGDTESGILPKANDHLEYDAYKYALGIRCSFEIYDMREMIVPFNPYVDIFASNSGSGSGGSSGGSDQNPTA